MKAGFSLFAASLLFLGLASAKADPAYPIVNLASVIQSLSLDTYYSTHTVSKSLKIAILDNSFAGYDKEVGSTLPSGTQYHAGPVASPSSTDRHGLVMAQIVYGVLTDLGKADQFSPEMHLYNTYGYSNFKSAVQDVIQRGIDIVLYSQVWEYGGNWDGKGFINALVSQATQNGVIWINASGDFGTTTFNYAINTRSAGSSDQWVSLPGTNESLPIDCAQNAAGTCALRLVLSWNDFKDDVNAGTNKDLDLYLTDDEYNTIEASTLVQTTDPTPKPGYSLYPREIIETQLKPGHYFIRVKNQSGNFTSNDRLRITATGDFITLPRHDTQETLLNPADNPTVITVGANDSDKSSASVALQRPDLVLPSLIDLGSGTQYKGSSDSAAIATGFFALVKSLHPDWNRGSLLNAFSAHHGVNPIVPGGGFPLNVLGFTYTNSSGCFVAINTAENPVQPYVQRAIAAGGTLVQTSLGPKLFYPFDPISIMPGIQRMQYDDILVIGPPTPQSPFGQTGVFPRNIVDVLNPVLIELVQTPLQQYVCQ